MRWRPAGRNTAVDKAEGEGKKVNELVNAVGSEIMAKACKKYDALMVYVSTDYVFDGLRTEGEYMPDDPRRKESQLVGIEHLAKSSESR